MIPSAARSGSASDSGSGVTPRKSDGLTWLRSDYSKDGVHPNNKGRQKAADQLLRFFKEDAGTRTWFVKR